MNFRRMRLILAILIGAIMIEFQTVPVALAVTLDLERAGWMVLALPGKDETRFVGLPNGAIEVSAENGAAFLYREVPPAERKNQRLSWRWRVDETMPPTDLALKGSDDRPLALHVWFPTN